MFPRQHWDVICNGSSKSCLVKPQRELTPNSKIDKEQIISVEEFLDKLVSLGILVEVRRGEMFATFLPPKTLPSLWCILTDMRQGGQNVCSGG
jgi:hypothetical protein